MFQKRQADLQANGDDSPRDLLQEVDLEDQQDQGGGEEDDTHGPQKAPKEDAFKS